MQLEGEDPIVMPYCRSPAPSRLSSGGYRPVNLPLAQHCFSTTRIIHILISTIYYLLQGTSRIRWPGIRLVRRLLGTRYASRGQITTRSLAVFARLVSGGCRWAWDGWKVLGVRRDVTPISNTVPPLL